MRERQFISTEQTFYGENQDPCDLCLVEMASLFALDSHLLAWRLISRPIEEPGYRNCDRSLLRCEEMRNIDGSYATCDVGPCSQGFGNRPTAVMLMQARGDYSCTAHVGTAGCLPSPLSVVCARGCPSRSGLVTRASGRLARSFSECELRR